MFEIILSYVLKRPILSLAGGLVNIIPKHVDAWHALSYLEKKKMQTDVSGFVNFWFEIKQIAQTMSQNFLLNRLCGTYKFRKENKNKTKEKKKKKLSAKL